MEHKREERDAAVDAIADDYNAGRIDRAEVERRLGELAEQARPEVERRVNAAIDRFRAEVLVRVAHGEHKP